jgi:hypothetical protein
MWQSNERYGIYHIREAIEEIVRSHVTVKLGRIHNESRFNDQNLKKPPSRAVFHVFQSFDYERFTRGMWKSLSPSV